jgi:anti-sigma factor ChrR (cupin superfamily)
MIPDELLFEYAMGSLDPAAAQTVEAALASSPALRASLAEIEALMADVGETLPPLAPSSAARDRLIEALSTTERWAPFFARLGKVVDLAVGEMRAVLDRARDALNWEPGPIPGVELFHFQGGPAAAAYDAGLVRMKAGGVAPIHRHLGDEWVFVLEGAFVDLNTGVTHVPGDLIHHGPGSEHAFKVTDGADLIYALVVSAEVQIVGWPST